jgi:hypothetical protein
MTNNADSGPTGSHLRLQWAQGSEILNYSATTQGSSVYIWVLHYMKRNWRSFPINLLGQQYPWAHPPVMRLPREQSDATCTTLLPCQALVCLFPAFKKYLCACPHIMLDALYTSPPFRVPMHISPHPVRCPWACPQTMSGTCVHVPIPCHSPCAHGCLSHAVTLCCTA